MGVRKFYSKQDVNDMLDRFGTKARPVYFKSLDDDHTIEANMKESLNRIGDNDEQSGTINPEDDGSERTSN